jgi:predicted nucleic acid-binding protein
MAGVAVLDASALIALFNSKDLHHSWAISAMHDTLDLDLTIPALTYAEALVVPFEKNFNDDFLAGISGLDLEVTSLDSHEALEIAELRAETKLRIPDAVVLHSAIKQSATLITADAKLAMAARIQGLKVFTPATD